MTHVYPTLITALICLVCGCGVQWTSNARVDGIAGREQTVVLLHGLGRSKSAMWLLQSRLEDAGFRVCPIGYDSLRHSPAQILETIGVQIRGCAVQTATNTHFVGHSLGGLFVRAYLQDHQIANLGYVVLLGTPNRGSKIVDRFEDTRWLPLFGPTAMLLGTGEDSFPNSLEKPYYPVGVIAGVSDATVSSRFFSEPHDGLVTVASTKLNGMADFCIVETSHTMMRYDARVAHQVIAFLRNRHFAHETCSGSRRPNPEGLLPTPWDAARLSYSAVARPAPDLNLEDASACEPHTSYGRPADHRAHRPK